MLSRAQIQQVQGKQTYTYVRCWYRPAATHDDPYTTWEWQRMRMVAITLSKVIGGRVFDKKHVLHDSSARNPVRTL